MDSKDLLHNLGSATLNFVTGSLVSPALLEIDPFWAFLGFSA